MPGDFVDFTCDAGKLDFFLIAQGATSPKQTWSTNAYQNIDKKAHFVVFSKDYAGSTYLIYCAEDLTTSGKDFDLNDVAFVVRISAPEPNLVMGGIMFSMLFLGIRRRA